MRRNTIPAQPDPKQKKITHFFTKNPPGTPTPSSSQSSSSCSVRRRPPNILPRHPVAIVSLGTPSPPRPKPKSYSPLKSDDEDILEVIEVPKPPPSPKELVVISSDSDSEPEPDLQIIDVKEIKPEIMSQDEDENEEELDNPPSPSLLDNDQNPSNHDAFEEAPSPSDEILSQVDIDEVIRASQEEKENKSVTTSPDKCGTFDDEDNGSSSGDEVLSQIDVEEVIRSQSSIDSPNKQDTLLTPKDSQTADSSTQSSNSSGFSKPLSPRLAKLTALINSREPPTPTKSAKSSVSKFSPIRHINKAKMKRTSSEASLGSPQKLESPSKEGSVSDRSPKKKLNFDSASTSNGNGMGGGRYYIRNFMSILTDVITDTFHAHLISSEDHKTVQRFTSLSLHAQSLYVRLFQRQWQWKPMNKLNKRYKELPEDLLPVCRELTEMGFFEEISASTATLEEILDVIDLPKILLLAKKMMVNMTKKTKEFCKEKLLAKVKNQKTLTGSSTNAAPMMKQALQELGPAFRVTSESKTLFSRLFILYSPPQYWEIESDQASNQLLVILLNSMGQMTYPTYKIRKETLVYRSREDLIKFHESFTMHSNLVAWAEDKNWDMVIDISTKAERMLSEHLENWEAVEYDTTLPKYLRIHKAGSVLTHVCWMGVDAFQKLKRFKEANELLRKILGQHIYLTNYRGRCWERLAINEGHLKKSKEDIRKLLEEGLSDPHLQMNHKLILSQRWEKANPVSKKKGKEKPKKVEIPKTSNRRTRSQARRKKYIDTSSDEDEEAKEEVSLFDMDTEVATTATADEDSPLILTLKQEAPTRTITGEKMDRGPGNMGKAYFISRQDSASSNVPVSVEQHAINYYLNSEGYTSGLHGEGSTVCTIYGLLFWDIIFFDDLPDAFHTRYQGYPLDLHFEDFYLRRESLILEKLDLIRNILSIDDLFGLVQQVWAENEGKLSIVSWSLFESPERLRGLMRAMGTAMIADICERLSKNYRYFHSGFPDLVVWNEEEGKVLFVEVKGPGDSLSPKQQLWLDWMMEKGIKCEVCYVKAVSNKRIRLD